MERYIRILEKNLVEIREGFLGKEVKKMENQGKKLIIFGAIVLVLVLVVGGLALLRGKTLITVTGEGRVTATPTRVSFDVGIVNVSSSAGQALTDNLALTHNITEITKLAGVKPEKIIVSYPIVSALTNGSYRATNVFNVTLDDINRFDSLVKSIYEGGASSVQNVSFSVENSKDLEKQAVDKAIEDAKVRAKEIARRLGKRVVRVVSLSTQETGEAATAGGVRQSSGGESIATPSQIEIARFASVVFELR